MVSAANISGKYPVVRHCATSFYKDRIGFHLYVTLCLSVSLAHSAISPSITVVEADTQKDPTQPKEATMIDISPVFKDLLEIAWGSHYGNIRIAGGDRKASLSWHRATELETVSQSEGTHAFWSTSSFITPVSKAAKADMSHVGVIWVDIDETIIDFFSPEPNFIIHTSPGKMHLFYVIDPVSIQSPKEIKLLEAVQSALSVHLGGDKGSRDLGHISRVPGSINPKNGYEVHIEQLHSRVYTLAELNPNALAPGEGRHHDAVKKLASAAAAGENIEETLEQLEAVAYTEPFGDEEREGLLNQKWDVAKYAPEPVADMQVDRWEAESKPKVIDYRRALEGFDIAFNVIGGNLMLKGTQMTDSIFAQVHEHFEVKGFPVVTKLEFALKSAAEGNDRHNPIINYIGKTKWDGDDHIAYLATFFNDDGEGDFEIFLRHWLVGAVAKASKPEGAFNRMLVLEGPQGIGKSEFAKWLCPLPLRDYFCQDIPQFDMGSKDTVIKLTNRWIWEIQELGQATTKYQDQLKSFLSQTKVSERAPYAKYAMNEITRASFIGTVNDLGGFLTDPSGNRRYMAAAITDIDWQGYTVKVDLRQVWAQALALFEDGFDHELSGEAERRADEANASFVSASPLAEQLDILLETDPEDPTYGMTTAEIMLLLTPLGKPFSPQEVAGAMRVNGGRQVRKRIDGKHVRIWVGTKERVQVNS